MNNFINPNDLPQLEDKQPTPEELQALQQVPAPQVETPDTRLEDAQAEGNKQRHYANMLRGFQQVLQGAASGSGWKADMSGVDAMEKNASLPEQQIKDKMAQEASIKKTKQDAEDHKAKMDEFQIKIAQSGIDLTNEKENVNPVSSVSQIAQARVMQQQKAMGQPVDENQIKSMSAKQLFPLFPFLQQDAHNILLQKQFDAELKSKEEQKALDRQNRLDIEKEKAENKKDSKEEKASEGQRAVDKDYAKHYNEFTSKGVPDADISISKMDALADEMEKDTGFGQAGGGRIGSILPDVARSRDSIRRRDSARNLANRTLKVIFGAQLSDAEREAAAKEYYNDALSNEENSKILRQKINELKTSFAQEKAKAKYYEQNNSSLKGFSGTEMTNQAQSPQTGPLGETTERNGKQYKWNPSVGKYQLLGQ